MKLRYVALVLTLCYAQMSVAQKSITRNNQQWVQYFNQLKMSDKTTLYTDVSIRRANVMKDMSLLTFRTGIGYNLTNNIQGITGLACFTTYSENKASRIEFRPFQDFNTTSALGKLTILHRLRLEARYFRKITEGKITTDDNFNFRFRYKLTLAIPVAKLSSTDADKKLFLNLADEIFINAGKEITYNMFDNNRYTSGVALQLSKSFNMSLNYIYQFGQRYTSSTSYAYEHTDIILLSFVHKLSLTKPTPTAQ